MTDNCTPLSVTDLSIACDLLMSACELLDRYDPQDPKGLLENIDRLGTFNKFHDLLKHVRYNMRMDLSKLEMLKDIEGELE